MEAKTSIPSGETRGVRFPLRNVPALFLKVFRKQLSLPRNTLAKPKSFLFISLVRIRNLIGTRYLDSSISCRGCGALHPQVQAVGGTAVWSLSFVLCYASSG